MAVWIAFDADMGKPEAAHGFDQSKISHWCPLWRRLSALCTYLWPRHVCHESDDPEIAGTTRRSYEATLSKRQSLQEDIKSILDQLSWYRSLEHMMVPQCKLGR